MKSGKARHNSPPASTCTCGLLEQRQTPSEIESCMNGPQATIKLPGWLALVMQKGLPKDRSGVGDGQVGQAGAGIIGQEQGRDDGQRKGAERTGASSQSRIPDCAPCGETRRSEV